MTDYSSFLSSPCGSDWKRLGVGRRAGILAPLFSVHSSQSAGVGEFRDLELLADWCRQCGMSLIQLLPLNDVGSRFCPYDSESSFALEPMHLALDDLAGIPSKKYADEILALRRRFASSAPLFDTGIKREKLALLRKIFFERSQKRSREFEAFREEQDPWLSSYALFKLIKETDERSWQDWPEPLKKREPAALRRLAEQQPEELAFYEWLQWQLFRQFTTAASRVRKKKVHLLGDLPFLVARDSADVWAHPEYFKLGLSAGAPPDLYFADGQEWGMPPYDWEAMAASGYGYLKDKLRFASNFYDLYRLDHFVGLFRVWAFPLDQAPERKKRAFFDPPDETVWEGQARRILSAMLEAAPMLPCAEDLGTVPPAAQRLLDEYAIPGMDVQRWMRDWDGTGEFSPPETYRRNSIVTLSTHDMTSFLDWWRTEATPEDKERFLRFLGLTEAPADERTLLRAALEKAHRSASIFSVHSFQDWLGSEGRINRPGVMAPENWRLRIPFSLEQMLELPSNHLMREMNAKALRA